ncbi:putative phenol monooxygenase [Periconia macrospinosa]|uniref:Putative phenol monooxygenase n=1 Tax=Periconia macrospinosa TaxID=97972 RepID=A0A2V1DUD4_9PLEO|nr:putative phenol monooxygenase [Periconia macrospinosa]
MVAVRVPVLIVGGGGCGLVASSILSNLAVAHVLVEAHPSTSNLPKAHILNQRTAEILSQHQLWEHIVPFGTPRKQARYFRYVSSFGGNGPLDRVPLGKVSCFGWNDEPDVDEENDALIYDRDSPVRGTNLPQIRLEPILRLQAERRNPGKVLFHHRVVGFAEQEDHVVVDVVNQATGETIQYLADYVLAADGGKTFGPALGIELAGPRNVGHVTTIHFKANLARYWVDGTMAYWLVNVSSQEDAVGPSPLFGAEWNTLVPMGPTWGPDCEEFGLHLGMAENHPPVESLTDDDIKHRVRTALNIPDLDLEILKASRWNLEGITATQYQTNRIFLAGDAVHRHPPTTGLGLNTAIGDVHNITWKLAAVLKHHASPSLLKTYQTERLPIGKRVTQWALFTFLNLRLIDAAVGLFPGGKAVRATNEQIYQQLLADTFDGAARRAAVQYAVQSQRVELGAHDLDLGAVYPGGALVADGSMPPVVDPRGIRYTPTARPGHRLPHAWLQGSTRISTHQLVDQTGSWALLTDDSADGTLWIQKAADLEERRGLKINKARIGPLGDLKDEDGQWAEHSGLEACRGGAVLVRPDTYVAFRAREFSQKAVDRLEMVFL